ncbi:choline ABC transporter substrate-binding protein [Sodalis ligni]|uniref:Glycine betaine/proline transport system substrate-binding protein n=1 Tax=Sodalis ligni TaxID=2697027 RepID=A0A4R1NC15_9GAMM|nr:choline ABC transporter substrate-binding protein [Sodalis ligni]TCL04279.1 glycine betaine/proline transport system substrate-binding protein [Sodalis ligni]
MRVFSAVFTLGMSLAVGLPVAYAADNADCGVVKMSDPGWTDIGATNGVAGVLLEGLGYKQQVQNLSVALAYQGLKTGQLDVFLGNWMPAQQPVISKFTGNGSVQVLGANLNSAKFTLAVPDYVARGGVKDFADLAGYGDKFDRKIYGIAPGAPANQNIKTMLDKHDFNLTGWTLVESSESGMLAQVDRAVAKQQWIVFLGWEPHAMNTHHKLVYLSGGDKYFGPNYGSATVNTVTRKDYSALCPNAGRLFSQLTFTVDLENVLIKRALDDKQTPRDAAREELKQHPELLSRWLDGVTTLQGQPGLAAVRQSLAL